MIYFAILILDGLPFLALGFYFLRARISFIKTGIATEATVIRIELDKKESNYRDEEVTVYRPHFKVITHKNEEIKFVHGISTEWGKWSIGDKIKVIYNDAIPGTVVVNTFWEIHGKPIILFSIAFTLIAAGIYVYLVQ